MLGRQTGNAEVGSADTEVWLCSPDSSQMRRASENGTAQRRGTDDSSVSGAKHQEPCHVALWFTESNVEQVTLTLTLTYTACMLACHTLAGG